MPMKADPATNERSCKRCKVAALGDGGVEVVLTLLTEMVALHMGLTIVDLLEVFLGILKGRDGSWRAGAEASASLGTGAPTSLASSTGSLWFTEPSRAEPGGAFLRAGEPGAIFSEIDIV